MLHCRRLRSPRAGITRQTQERQLFSSTPVNSLSRNATAAPSQCGAGNVGAMGNVAFQEAQFGNFVERLLLRELDVVPWPAHIHIMAEAEIAATIAANTPYRFLVFPCLFEERVSACMCGFHQREAEFWRPVAASSSEQPRLIAPAQ